MTVLFPDRLETDRLRLDVVDPASTDASEHYEAFADDPDPETVYEYVLVSEPTTPDESRVFVENAGSNRDDADAVTYAIYLTGDEPMAGTLAGTATLFVEWDREAASSAIVLRKPFWGRGYSGERAGALLGLAFDRLDLAHFGVSCVAGNDRSKRAIEKYVGAHGGRYDGRLRHAHAIDGEPVDLHWFSISRSEYLAATADVD
ncbi:GNAT family N-acetyltransferase [Halovivax asiaticus]|uniref:GNAT family N-acetyltransferase n=1 Tax=Halovivax asiaticus TaxID=332953 RepID=UPI00126750E8|nr:GNAT family protein [Halovivax asiaticus]